MRSRGRQISFAVLCGLLTGPCLSGSAVDGGEGKFRIMKTRKAAASEVKPADYSDSQQWETIDPEPQASDARTGDLDNPTVLNCPPAASQRLSTRVLPLADSIGTPLHHLNFSGDCYGENWRTQTWWCDPSHSGRFHQRTHSHSLGKERCWNRLFGILPRGYVHDTSGHPLRSFFVTQPSDPQMEYVPGSDTLSPPRLVYDYPKYVYQPGLYGLACDPGNEPSGRSTPIPATAPR